jgi:geranylgeranyl transferase type-2 subunit beta
VFGIAGLSLLGYEGLEEVDPVYCLPRKVVQKALTKEWKDNEKPV